MPPGDFLPAADLDTLRLRARLLTRVRRFFETRGYWEVETPLLSHDIVVDAHLDPFCVPRGDRGADLYLQTSPEFAMKRLLAAGADAIYQVCKAFRRGERGRLHNPEFTMVEWYRVGDTYLSQMQLVEDLVRQIFLAAAAEQYIAPISGNSGIVPPVFVRTTYAEAFRRHAGIEVFECGTARLIELAAERSVAVPRGLSPDDRDGWLNLLLAELIEPGLGLGVPEFLYDYPASQGALAVTRPGPPAIAERFELYFQGIELCNGYQELIDPDELRARTRTQAAIRERAGHSPLPMESRLEAAMKAGYPGSAGVALGFDRLVMIAAGKHSLEEVLAFPVDRA